MSCYKNEQMEVAICYKSRMLYHDDTCSLFYKRGRLIYHSGEHDNTLKIGNTFNRISLLERVMRKEPRCAARLDKDHILISFGGGILNYCISENTCVMEHHYAKGMNNPLEFLVVKGMDSDENDIFFGEYIWNSAKESVDIYKRIKGQWNCVYTFPEKTITHIHNIVYDSYRNGFFILTGDEDSESGIWFADCSFKSVRPILVGSQQYRACVAFPDMKGIFYATDTPLEENNIYYVELDDELNVIDCRKVYRMPGPCIFGSLIQNKMFFATSVEPDSTLPKWRYCITYKLGAGVTSRYSHIIYGDGEVGFSEYCKLKKDSLPMWLFQFGNVLFPKNDSQELYMVLQGLSLGHGVTVKRVGGN